jgi:hypothetical protein
MRIKIKVVAKAIGSVAFPLPEFVIPIAVKAHAPTKENTYIFLLTTMYKLIIAEIKIITIVHV